MPIWFCVTNTCGICDENDKPGGYTQQDIVWVAK